MIRAVGLIEKLIKNNNKKKIIKKKSEGMSAKNICITRGSESKS